MTTATAKPVQAATPPAPATEPEKVDEKPKRDPQPQANVPLTPEMNAFFTTKCQEWDCSKGALATYAVKSFQFPKERPSLDLLPARQRLESKKWFVLGAEDGILIAEGYANDFPEDDTLEVVPFGRSDNGREVALIKAKTAAKKFAKMAKLTDDHIKVLEA